MLKLIGTTALAACAAATLAVSGASATDLRLSDQFATSDMRNKMAQMIADEVEKANVDLHIKIYPAESLFKAKDQYRPLSRGQLDMSVYPLAYAAGQRPAYNATLMPGLVRNYDQAQRLVKSPFMDDIEKVLAKDDIMTLVHGYLGGAFGSTKGCIRAPEDVKGIQIRSAGKAFEEMLAKAGASINSMASSEIYNAMQTGVLDAANTSSESFDSYRLYEQVKCYTAPGKTALWFMYEPLLMNKSTFEGLKPEQQKALKDAAAKAEKFYWQQAEQSDEQAREDFEKAGVKVVEMKPEDFDKWLAVAKNSSYKEFVKQVPNGQKLLDEALAVK